jgi:serine/threonine-protein kinase
MTRSIVRKIQNYRILGVAGRGQFGRVLCAYEQGTGKIVALKELDKYRFPTHKLLRELRFMIDLQHPHIVQCYTLLHAEGYRYLVMEYCAGGTLRELMNFSPLLSPQQKLGLTIDILRGLAHAHGLGIVHCDIKPENILLKLSATGWQVKISDFGIAHLTQELDQHQGNRTGSPAYMAPERFYGQFFPSSDLYAVGIIVYELFTQERPFQGTVEELMTAHLNHRPPNLTRLPLALQEIISKVLAKLPAQRFGSAEEMIQALERVAAQKLDIPQLWQANFYPGVTPVQTRPKMMAGLVSALVSFVPDRARENQPWVFWAVNGQLYQDGQPLSQSLKAPIENLTVVREWLFAKTKTTLYQYALKDESPRPMPLFQHSTPFVYGVSSNGDWLIVARGKQLQIRHLRWGTGRSFAFPDRTVQQIIPLDQYYFGILTHKPETDSQRLIFLSRRGQMVGKLPLPRSIHAIVPSLTPYRLVLLESGAPPSLILLDLQPYRTTRLLLPFMPEQAIPTVWGYAITSGSVLVLLDLLGQNLANLQFPCPITHVTGCGNQVLVVVTAEGGQSWQYTLDLPQEGVELII